MSTLNTPTNKQGKKSKDKKGDFQFNDRKSQFVPEAVFLNKKGRIDSIKTGQISRPVISPNEVLIRVSAVGLNYEDILTAQNKLSFGKPPFIIGFECAGYIDEIGADVSKFQLNEKVLVLKKLGCCSKYIKTTPEYVYSVPPSMSLQDAAAFAMDYVTAYCLLFNCGNVVHGESVYIDYVNNGFGLAFAQLCSLIPHVKLYGYSKSQNKTSLINAGFTEIISDHHHYIDEILKITQGRGVDTYFNFMEEPAIDKHQQILSPLASYIICSKINPHFKHSLLHINHLIRANVEIGGFDIVGLLDVPHIFDHVLEELFTLYCRNQITPNIDSVFHVSRSSQALHYLMEKNPIGKVVLVWDSEDIVLPHFVPPGNESLDSHLDN